MNQEQNNFQSYEQEQHQKSGLFGGSTPAPTPPPPVPSADAAAATAVNQQALHGDPLGLTYASTLLTGAANPTPSGSVQKSTLLGG